jgi:hypothetical protein
LEPRGGEPCLGGRALGKLAGAGLCFAGLCFARLCFASVWILWSGTAAHAADGGEVARGGASLEAGYGQLAEDSFFNLRFKLGYAFEAPRLDCPDNEDAWDCATSLQLSAQAPLRLRLDDASPVQGGLLRQADWDEPSDYLRILRSLEYGHPTEALNAKLGELGPVSLGHGTVVGNYYNVVTLDHYQLGVSGTLNTVYGGAEVLLGDVVSPSVVGTRVFVHPWAFVDQDSVMSQVAVAATVVSDLSAPTRLAAAGGGGARVDQSNRLVVADQQTTTLWGIDVEMSVLDSERVGLVPYADFVQHTSLGNGIHAGTFVTVRPTDALEILSQVEYRRVSENYLPNYVGPLYEIERFQFEGWGQMLPAPKVRAAASIDTPVVHGLYGAVTGRYQENLSVTAAHADHQGPANQMVRLKVAARPIDSVHLGVFYHKQYFDEFSQVLDLDGSLAVGEARVGIYGPIFALGSYGRMWRVADTGVYQTVDQWNLGIGATLAF